MAASILSQDILAICLYLTEGNVDSTMEEIICRAESYQEEENRHFGITRMDFRNLFRNLFVWEMKVINIDNEIFDIKLSDTINYILNYQYAHFNDEGEHWIRDDQWKNDKSDSSVGKYWFGYNAKEYHDKLIMKQKMISFNNKWRIETINNNSIIKFPEELNIKDKTLYYCSRLGNSI